MPQTYVVHLGNSKELMEVAEDNVARRVLREHIRESLGVRSEDLLFAIINSMFHYCSTNPNNKVIKKEHSLVDVNSMSYYFLSKYLVIQVYHEEKDKICFFRHFIRVCSLSNSRS